MKYENVVPFTGSRLMQNKSARGDRVRRSRPKILLLSGLLAVLLAAPAFSANVTVPSLELYTWGRMTGSTFGLDSFGAMEMQLDGGYKFGGTIKFDFTSSELETAAVNDALAFRSASITLRDLFNIPLDLTYFIGEGDTFARGDLFPAYFATPLLHSRYTNYIHFPSAMDSNFYRGIHTINGTGLHFDLAPEEKNWMVSLYLYQDSAIDDGAIPVTLDPGYWSLDLRTALNFENLKLEAFLGATYPTPDSAIGYYRTGLLFFAGVRGVEFLAELGLPRWAPLDDTFTFDLFYLLVEQRVRLGLISVTQTMFWRPSHYLQQAMNEKALDVNLDLNVGKPEGSLASGGLEGNFVYQVIDDTGVTVNEIRVKVAPYVQFSTSGVVYELRGVTKLWPFDFSDMFELFLSVNASF